MDIRAVQRLGACDRNGVFRGAYRATERIQLHHGHTQKRRINARHRYRSARKSAAGKERARLNAVAYRGVLAGMQILKGNAFHRNSGGTTTRNTRAHSIEHVAQVNDFRFTRGVVDNGFALRHHRCHQHVFRGTYAGKIERNVRTTQTIGRLRLQVAMLHFKANAQLLQAQQMHVNLARANLATARHGHMSAAEASNQRS